MSIEKQQTTPSPEETEFYNNIQLDVIRQIFDISEETEIPDYAFIGWSFDRHEIYAISFRNILDELREKEDPVLSFPPHIIAEHVKKEMLKLYPELNHAKPH